MIDPTVTVVVGLGLAGRAVARAVTQRGMRAMALEDQPGDEHRTTAAEIGIELIEHPDAGQLRAAVEAATLVVPSPGVGDDHPVFAACRELGRTIGSEFDLAQLWDDRPLVAITGTDGKTTVTTMVLEMLRASGIAAVDAGNNDLPLVQAIDDPSTQVFVVEASSFRLGRSVAFSPTVATWLNWGPDHLDVHATEAAYEQAKAKIFGDLAETATAVMNLDDPVVMRNRPRSGAVVTFGLSDSADFERRDGQLWAGETPLVAVDQLQRALPHDIANALAAAATALAAGASLDAVRSVLCSFTGLAHRVQFVAEIDGISYYNDSKATTPHAVEAAVRGFRDVVLIAGGRNKGLALDGMADLADHLAHVVAIGDAADEIQLAFAGRRPVTTATSMAEAVAEATRRASAVDAEDRTVLLSPGCTSYDWYGNYGERGNDFMRIVRALAVPS